MWCLRPGISLKTVFLNLFFDEMFKKLIVKHKRRITCKMHPSRIEFVEHAVLIMCNFITLHHYRVYDGFFCGV